MLNSVTLDDKALSTVGHVCYLQVSRILLSYQTYFQLCRLRGFFHSLSAVIVALFAVCFVDGDVCDLFWRRRCNYFDLSATLTRHPVSAGVDQAGAHAGRWAGGGRAGGRRAGRHIAREAFKQTDSMSESLSIILMDDSKYVLVLPFGDVIYRKDYRLFKAITIPL